MSRPGSLDALGLDRASLGADLVAAPRAALLDLSERLGSQLHCRPRVPTEAGLSLLQLREPVRRQGFFVGEVPMALASVEVEGPDGRWLPGGAVSLTESPRLVEALALFDAVLVHRLAGWAEVAELARAGRGARELALRRRAEALGRTRVDFSLLSEAEPDEE
jgi:alpha-D-ribose 1-methylphosphonate 5-triphosphate synthase subunit PhnG